MAFELAAAYVELTEKGFNTVSGQIDKNKKAMEGLTGSGGTLSSKVEEVRNKLLEAGGASSSLSEQMQALQDAANGTSQAMGDMPLPDLADAAGSSGELADNLGDAKGEAKKLFDALGESGKSVGSLVTKFGRVAGVVGIITTAVWKVGDAILDWSLEDFRRELERATDLTRELASVHGQMTSDALAEADRLAGIEAKRAALQESLAVAMRDNVTAQREMRTAQERLTDTWTGWVKGFADGKWDEELEAGFERAKIRAEATKQAVGQLTEALGALENKKLDNVSALEQRLTEERILLEQGAEALRAYQLVQEGFSQDKATELAKQEFDLAKAQQEKQLQETIAETYKGQLQTLRLKAIEIEKGVEAAAAEADRLAGLSDQQRENLAAMRERIRLAEESKAKEEQLAEQARQAEEDAATEAQRKLEAQQAVTESFEKQVEQLRLKNILLTQGEQAADRERDRLAGYSAEQSQILARMRTQNALAAEWKKLQDAAARAAKGTHASEKGITAEKQKQAGGFASLSQLADLMQQKAFESAKQQREAGRPVPGIAGPGIAGIAKVVDEKMPVPRFAGIIKAIEDARKPPAGKKDQQPPLRLSDRFNRQQFERDRLDQLVRQVRERNAEKFGSVPNRPNEDGRRIDRRTEGSQALASHARISEAIEGLQRGGGKMVEKMDEQRAIAAAVGRSAIANEKLFELANNRGIKVDQPSESGAGVDPAIIMFGPRSRTT